MSSLSASPWRSERGSGTAETAVAFPALLTLLLAIVQLALWAHAAHLVHAAAQEGLRAARVDGGGSAAAQARAAGLLDELAPTLITDRRVHARRDETTARVEVTGRLAPLLPGLRLPLHATAEGPLERLTAPEPP